ncbi:MAG: hypothetical protein JOZ12_00920 [Sinobacteraceae bacterium]|nr:hypothetical protein [Nevskiaceae bacterium]
MPPATSEQTPAAAHSAAAYSAAGHPAAAHIGAAQPLVHEIVPDQSNMTESIAAIRAEDIRGVELPARVPLQMEAKEPVYLRPRDALSGLHRLWGGARTTTTL